MEISVRQGLLDPTFGFPQDLQESESPNKLYTALELELDEMIHKQMRKKSSTHNKIANPY